MLLDRRYDRPSDNPLRVIAYALTSCLIAYFVLIAVAHAQFNGRVNEQQEQSGGGSRTSTSWSNGSSSFRDAMNAGSNRSGSPNRDTCGCTNNAGRMSGPV